MNIYFGISFLVNKLYTFKRKLFKSLVSFLAEDNVVFTGVIHPFGKTDDNVLLRTFALIVSAHPYCARNTHATSCIERAR